MRVFWKFGMESEITVSDVTAKEVKEVLELAEVVDYIEDSEGDKTYIITDTRLRITNKGADDLTIWLEETE